MAGLAFGLRPRIELYDINADPHQMNNLAGLPAWREIETSLKADLFGYLRKTNDPRVVGGPVLWDYYPYYGAISTKGWKVDPRP